MNAHVSGGCRCGLIRYEGLRHSAVSFRCHCRDCQQLTGGGHADMLPLSIDNFTISAQCQTYEMPGGSGAPTYSGFCPVCGAQLTRNSSLMDDRIYVHAGSLDDPSQYVPAKSIYASAAQPWDGGCILDDK